MKIISIIKTYYRTLIFAIIIMIISFIPINSSNDSAFFNIPHLDKIVHVIIYTTLSFIVLIEYVKNDSVANQYLIVPLIFSFFYGGIIELAQLFIPGRGGEFLDVIANLAGCLISLPLYKLYYKFK